MSYIIAFCMASIMLCFGMLIRMKVPFIQNMLVPASVVAGVLGFITMNSGFFHIVSSQVYVNMVTFIFTITFISLGLTSHSQSSNNDNVGRHIVKGSVGMGFIWNILYAITPAIGAVIIMGIGGFLE